MYDKKWETNEINQYTVIKRISGLFIEILGPNYSEESFKSLMQYKNDIISLKKDYSLIDAEYQQVMNSLKQRLNYFLVECCHKQTSSLIREFLFEIFNVEYKCDDFSLIDSVLPLKDYPCIFTKEIYSNIKSFNKERELKETSQLFTTYDSDYPYDKTKSYQALMKMSEKYGRIKMYEGFFLWFSEYYDLYSSTIESLMKKDELIPVTWKYYLGIMAVSTIRCEYLLRDLELQFLLKGGDESWLLLGLSVVPEKLRMLGKINNLLAHQPWKFQFSDLTEVYFQYNNKGWSTTELILAILILTNFHRLATVVEAMKFNVKEPDFNQSSPTKIDDNSLNVKKNIISELELINKNESNGQEIQCLRKPSVEKCKNSAHYDSLNSDYSTKDFNKHTSSFCTVYLDFDSHSEDYYSHIEFNWDDHASYILQNFHQEGINSINEEIEYITSTTSNNIGGDKKVDTHQYRYTISCYVEKIFGVSNESFDYSKTNKLLHRSHKQFIKNIACFPQRITKMDIGVLKVTFNPEEIYHIILLTSVVKMRLQLTFFTKPLYEIIKSID